MASTKAVAVALLIAAQCAQGFLSPALKVSLLLQRE